MIAAPSVDPFPLEAILRETPLGEEGVVYADLDYEMLEEARTNGEVRNWQDRNEGDWTAVPRRAALNTASRRGTKTRRKGPPRRVFVPRRDAVFKAEDARPYLDFLV